jgi:hypothetical protein
MGHLVRRLTVFSNASADFGAGLNDSVGSFMPFQSLPVHIFGTALTKISEFCLEKATSLVDVVSLVGLSQMLLRNAPEGLNTRFLSPRFVYQLLQEP